MTNLMRVAHATLLSLALVLGLAAPAEAQLKQSSSQLRSTLTDPTGTGAAVFGTAPIITLPNATGLPLATGLTGLGTGVATALGVNVGSAGAPVLFNGAAGTPSSIVLTNATGLPSGVITTGLGFTPANVAGDTFTGDVTLSTFLSRNTTGVHTVRLINLHTSGFSGLRIDKNDQTEQVNFGFGNSGTAAPYAGNGYLKFSAPSDFHFVAGTTLRGTMFASGGFAWGTAGASDPGANNFVVGGTSLLNGAVSIGNDVTFTTSSSQFLRNASGNHVLRVSNAHVGGFSAFRFDKNDGTEEVNIGYGNASTSAPYTSSGFLRYVPEFKFVQGATLRGTMFASGGLAWGSTTDPGANNFLVGGTLEVTGNVTRNQASVHTLNLINASASGYSSIRYNKSDGTEQLNFGFGNASTSAPYQSSGFLRYVPDFKFVQGTTLRGVMWASGGFSWGANTTDPGANNVMFNGTIYTPKSGINGFFSYLARPGPASSELIYSTDTQGVGAFGVHASNPAGYAALVYRGADTYEHSAIGVSNPDTGGWSEEKAQFTGVISGTTLTASSVTGTLRAGQLVLGSGVTEATYIDADTGGAGGAGTYTVTKSQTVSSTAMTSRVGLAYWEASTFPAWNNARPMAVTFRQTGWDDTSASSVQRQWLYRSEDFITTLYGRTAASLRINADNTISNLTATTFSAAITYGGVTLTNNVTGTGKMVLDTTPTLVTPVIGVATGTSLAVSGLLTSSSATAGIGYATGACSTVTQSSSKSTSIGTKNNACLKITMNGAALSNATTVSFAWTNSAIAATDYVACNHESVGTLGAYVITVTPAGGSATVNVRNVHTGSLSEAIVMRCVVVKATDAHNDNWKLDRWTDPAAILRPRMAA